MRKLKIVVEQGYHLVEWVSQVEETVVAGVMKVTVEDLVRLAALVRRLTQKDRWCRFHRSRDIVQRLTKGA